MSSARHRFLSPAWVDAVAELRRNTPAPENLPVVVINMTINEAPDDIGNDGTVEAHLDTASGVPELTIGLHDDPDVAVITNYDTATALLVEVDPAAAMNAFLRGEIVIQGEMLKLMALNGALAADPSAGNVAAAIRLVHRLTVTTAELDAAGEAVRGVLGERVIEWDGSSIYEWSPVFRATVDVGGRHHDVVVKRAIRNLDSAPAIAVWQQHLAAHGLPVNTPLDVFGGDTFAFPAGEANWIVYPFVAGSPTDGSIAQLAAAGTLLGRMHTVAWGIDLGTLRPFGWPDHDGESTADDVELMTGVINEELGLDADAERATIQRWTAGITSFNSTTLAAVRSPDLPVVASTLDFRALNLIYTDAALPTAIDFEKGELAPRLLDLAFATVFFSCEAPSNPGRLFDGDEWAAFRDAYLVEAPPFTDAERATWPAALMFMYLEEGIWHLGESPEWDLPNQRRFLVDLATSDPTTRFPL